MVIHSPSGFCAPAGRPRGAAAVGQTLMAPRRLNRECQGASGRLWQVLYAFQPYLSAKSRRKSESRFRAHSRREKTQSARFFMRAKNLRKIKISVKFFSRTHADAQITYLHLLREMAAPSLLYHQQAVAE